MIHELTAAPPPGLSRALEAFEARFQYPLGVGRWFRVSHGEDYPRFFRAMGEGACFVAEEAGEVRGALCVALRTLLGPAGEVRAAYIGDVKVAPEARSGRTFLRLVRAAEAFARPRVAAAYGVVMEGTPVTPESYTGRLGLERFARLARVLVCRLETAPDGEVPRGWVAPPDRVAPCFLGLRGGRHAAVDGRSAERSAMEPVGLLDPAGAACGIVEDTRRAKRLFTDDGEEMASAHLTQFAWRDAGAGAALVHAARRVAAAAGFGALFVTVPEAEAGGLVAALGPVPCVVAPALVYGVGLREGVSWLVNSAEI